MTDQHFPEGWNEERVRRVLAQYDIQTDAEAAAEDDAAFTENGRTVLEVPAELMPVIRELIGQYLARTKA